MATDVTYMCLNKWILFFFEEIFNWILFIEVFQTKIINRMILPSILELLLWSTGKVRTCFCITKKKN